MKKIIFVFIRLFGSATVVAFTYLNFNLPAEYLAVIGILTYALIDFLGRPTITFLLALKNLKSFRKAFVYTISKKPEKVASTESGTGLSTMALSTSIPFWKSSLSFLSKN